MMLKNLDRDDITAIHMQGMVSRQIRAAGQGGLGRVEMTIKMSLGDELWVTSLVEWLESMELAIRINGSELQGNLAAGANAGVHERIALNKRGIVLEAEMGDGEVECEVPLRIGQCWGLGKDIVEVVGLQTDKVEIMEWSRKDKREKGRLGVSSADNFAKYPTGMGSRNWIDKEVLRQEARKLYELGKDSAKWRILTCSVVEIRNRRIA